MEIFCLPFDDNALLSHMKCHPHYHCDAPANEFRPTNLPFTTVIDSVEVIVLNKFLETEEVNLEICLLVSVKSVLFTLIIVLFPVSQ